MSSVRMQGLYVYWKHVKNNIYIKYKYVIANSYYSRLLTNVDLSFLI